MPIVVLNGSFHVGHEHGLPRTVGALGVASCANEVRVDGALPAARVGQDESGAAFPAEHRALQVVVVGLGFLPGRLARVEHDLDPVPHLGGDQRLMQPVIVRAPEGD